MERKRFGWRIATPLATKRPAYEEQSRNPKKIKRRRKQIENQRKKRRNAREITLKILYKENPMSIGGEKKNMVHKFTRESKKQKRRSSTKRKEAGRNHALLKSTKPYSIGQ